MAFLRQDGSRRAFLRACEVRSAGGSRSASGREPRGALAAGAERGLNAEGAVSRLAARTATALAPVVAIARARAGSAGASDQHGIVRARAIGALGGTAREASVLRSPVL